MARPMKDCCHHENSFGTYSCCKEHGGRPCTLVVFSPTPLEEKTHGFSQRQQSRMEMAGTMAVQTVGAPIIHAMFVRAVPFPLIPPPQREEKKGEVSRLVLPKNGT